jgi:CheY-like chemotaxis protein
MMFSILVVDDEAATCDALRRVFEAHGYEVHIAHTALEAADVVTRHHVKLALIDWALPGTMSGDRLGRMLRKQGIAIFLMSGFTKQHIRQEWRDPLEGTLGFYSKPLDMNEILRDVARVAKTYEDTEP